MTKQHLWIALALVMLAWPAQAKEQTRFYAPNGQSAGTAARNSTGSTRYYDPRGNSTGTSTTAGGTTTFYDSRGRVIGRATAPPK
jgi:YD repeat-containing protein